MDKKFLRDQMIKLETNYGADKFKITKEVFELWLEVFSDCEKDMFEKAVINTITSSDYPPVISTVMKQYKELEEYRNNLSEVLHRQYEIMRNAWGEPIDKETKDYYVSMIKGISKDKRIERAVEITHEAISYHHDCEYDGITPPKLIVYLRGGK